MPGIVGGFFRHELPAGAAVACAGASTPRNNFLDGVRMAKVRRDRGVAYPCSFALDCLALLGVMRQGGRMNSDHTSDLPSTALHRKLTATALGMLFQHRTLLGAFALRGVGILAGLALTFMLGRYLGAAATGTYAVITQTTTFLAAIGLLGLEFSVVRHLSRPASDRRPIATVMLVQVIGTAVAVLGMIAMLVVFGGPIVWDALLGDVVGPEFALVVCVTLVLRGLGQLVGGVLRAQHQMMLGIAVALVIVPVISASALLLGITATVHEILWATAAGAAVAVGTGLAFSLRYVRSAPDALKIPMRQIMASSLPLWGAGMSLVFSEWYALAVVARTLSTADAGVFRVATQIAGTLMIITTTISSVYMAQISSAFHAGDKAGVARLGRTAVRASFVLAFPLAMAIIIAAYFFLPVIGPEFVAAMPLIVVMVTGQLLIALFGPSGLVLSMSGRERISLAISIAGTIALLVFAPVAAVHGGAIGVAACVSMILVARNLFAFVFVRNRLGIRMWSGTVAGAAMR